MNTTITLDNPFPESLRVLESLEGLLHNFRVRRVDMRLFGLPLITGTLSKPGTFDVALVGMKRLIAGSVLDPAAAEILPGGVRIKWCKTDNSKKKCNNKTQSHSGSIVQN